MRKVTFGVANSLDNFIARKDHGVDWLLWTKEVASVTAKFWKTIDTVVMGRKTYEVALKSGNPRYFPIKFSTAMVMVRTPVLMVGSGMG